MYDPDDGSDLGQNVGRRLRLTRAALRYADQKSFGEAAGLQQSHYTRFENGSRLLTLAAAMVLCERFDLTLDWLYRGDPSGLPYRLASEINSLRKNTT